MRNRFDDEFGNHFRRLRIEPSGVGGVGGESLADGGHRPGARIGAVALECSGKFGPDGAGNHGRDGNAAIALRDELLAKASGESDESVFGGTVSAAKHVRNPTQDRPHVYDGAPAALFEVWKDRLNAEQRGLEIDGNHGVELLLGCLFDEGGHTPSGIVDPRGNLRKRSEGGVPESFDVAFSGHIAGNRNDSNAASLPPALPRNVFQAAGPASRDRDGKTASGQQTSRGRTDSRGGACDHGRCGRFRQEQALSSIFARS
jgi:hypothetical protein